VLGNSKLQTSTLLQPCQCLCSGRKRLGQETLSCNESLRPLPSRAIPV